MMGMGERVEAVKEVFAWDPEKSKVWGAGKS